MTARVVLGWVDPEELVSPEEDTAEEASEEAEA
jgi:N utilization substance protein A